MKKVRVRFAPSPTGPLHLGGMRTALYNYLFAKKHGGDFILRIEDTDGTRFVRGAEDYIIKALEWCGITPNEGVGFGEGDHAPYKQSHRNDWGIYEMFVKKLIENGNAYYAFDTKEEIDAMKSTLIKSGVKSPSYNSFMRMEMKNSLTMSTEYVKEKIDAGEPYVVRIKMPHNEEIKFHDLVRGWVTVKSHNIDDKVLFKSDGMPTYHLANVVDDYMMKITHVIRGEEWLPSAPLHVMLYKFLGWETDMPEFVHLPLILGPNGKLSKRDGDALGFPVYPLKWIDPITNDVSSGYRERGYLPEAFLNMIALIGWNPGGNIEMMSLDEMVEKFSFDKINKSGGKFDLKKAEWFNKSYMMKADNNVLADLWLDICPELKSWMEKAADQSSAKKYIASVASLMKEKFSYIDMFWDNGKYFFAEPDIELLPKYSDYKDMESFVEVMLGWLTEKIKEKETIDHDIAKQAFDNAVHLSKVDAREAGRFLRFALTGMKVGPPIFDVMAIINVEECYKRITKINENAEV